MENTTNNDVQKKPNIKMIGIILAVIILVIVVVLALTSKREETPKGQEGTTTEEQTQTQTQGQIMDENGEMVEVIITESGQAIPEGSTVEVVGANPIKENVVVTPTGEATKNDVAPMSSNAPQQTPPLAQGDLPSSTKKLDVSATGFSPSSFEVKAGAPVILSLTGKDATPHVLMFDDGALSAVVVGVGPGETRAITFNAPATAGEYSFRCDVPGHAVRGEVGKMIVK